MTTYKYRLGGTLDVDQNAAFSAKIMKKDVTKPNTLSMGILKNTSLALGDEIKFYDLDNNYIFGGYIQKIQDSIGIQSVSVADYSIQLSQIIVNEVFENKKPEEVIEYVIDNYTDLTFVNNLTATTSAITTLVKQDAWGIDIIKQMLELFNGGYTVDKNKNFTLYQRQDTVNANTLTYGEDSLEGSWNSDIGKKAEKVIVKGANVPQRTTETLSGTGTIFYTTRIPEDIEISGKTQTTETITGDYTVDKQNKKITFDSSQTDPSVSYTYQSQIKIELGDPEGKTVVLEKKYIESKSEARKLAREYIGRFADGAQSSKWIKSSSSIDDYNVDESIYVTDDENDKTGFYNINRVTLELPSKMIIEVGEVEDDLFDWQKEAIERIKQLEQKDQNSDFVTTDEYIKGDVKVSLTVTFTELKEYIDDGDVLFASDTTLSTDADLISDTGIDADYALAYDDSAVPSKNVNDLLS